MATIKTSFILHKDILAVAIDQLSSDDQLGKLFRAICKYNNGEEYKTGDINVDIVMSFFVKQFEVDEDKYIEKCKKNRENIKKRWSNTNVNDRIRPNDPNTNHTYNDNSIDSISTDIESNTDQSNSSPKEKAEKESPLTTAKVGDIIEVKGCKVVKRSQGKIFKIPDIGEIDSYIREKGYHFSAQSFYDYYSSSSPHPWCKANGEPVSSWKQCCSTFESVFLQQEDRRSINNHSPSTEAHADINSRQYEQF